MIDLFQFFFLAVKSSSIIIWHIQCGVLGYELSLEKHCTTSLQHQL